MSSLVLFFWVKNTWCTLYCWPCLVWTVKYNMY
jgi:hypothetical protein